MSYSSTEPDVKTSATQFRPSRVPALLRPPSLLGSGSMCPDSPLWAQDLLPGGYKGRARGCSGHPESKGPHRIQALSLTSRGGEAAPPSPRPLLSSEPGRAKEHQVVLGTGSSPRKGWVMERLVWNQEDRVGKGQLPPRIKWLGEREA